MEIKTYHSLDEKQNLFTSFQVNSKKEMDEMLVRLNRLEANMIYRGVNEAKYKMFTSAQRQWQAEDIPFRTDIADFNDYIERILDNLRRETALNQYYTSVGVIPNDFLYLSLLQHYAAPTPLLDFTHNIRTALYFATKDIRLEPSDDDINSYFSLYTLDVGYPPTAVIPHLDSMFADGLDRGKQLYESSIQTTDPRIINKSKIDRIDLYTKWHAEKGSSGLRDIPLAFIENPQHACKVSTPYTHEDLTWSNLRIIAQEGCFLLYNNNPICSLEDYFASKRKDWMIGSNNPFVCYNIHKSLAGYIKENYLQGITETTLFPDLSSIVRGCAARV